MNILGISGFYHDSAACLVRDGIIVAAAQEERFSRKKHDAAFPEMAISYCLNNSKLTINDIDYVVFYEKPFLKFERLLETYLQFVPFGLKSFIKAMPVWIKQKIWIKEIIKETLNFKGEILFVKHHQAHAASAFFPSPFSTAAFLTMDGVGEWSTTSFGIGRDNKIQLLADIKFPHSIGLLYSAFTYFCGFKVNSGEYKLMGLAPYGEPKYKKIIYEHLVDLKDDGSFRLNLAYFDFMAGLKMTNKKFAGLFGGPPRKPESEITQREMDLARSIQEVTEEIVLKAANYVYSSTGEKNLTLAGGVALNCVANGRLLRESNFADIWIQPAAGDAGGALGAALFVWHQYLENERFTDEQNDFQFGSYLGPQFSSNEIEKFLSENNIPFSRLSDDELSDQLADIIADEKVVGYFRGRMEFGPRALGARSIIGDARSANMQSVMNLKIKFRESFRPFAPAVLAENVEDYFEIGKKSPYMLLIAPVKKSMIRDLSENEKKLFGIEKLKVQRSDVPAITHIDNTARIQTVHRETNPLFHDIIGKLKDKHNCGLVINTSFNVRGEPIVCSPEDAYRCFMRTNIDYLVLENYLIDKTLQDKSKIAKFPEISLILD